MIITLIGPYPPAYGGVSIHIQRLRQRLKRANFDVQVWCPAGINVKEDGIYKLSIRKHPLCYFDWLLDSLKILPGEIIHFHELRPYSLWILATIYRGQRCVVTVHNQIMMEQKSFFCWLSQWTVRRIGSNPNCRMIAVNSEISKQLQKLGVPPEHITVIPAFFPSEDPVCIEKLPPEILKFAATHRPLLTVYGMGSQKLYGVGCVGSENSSLGVDRHGFDLSIEAVALVRKKYTQAGLIILVPYNQDEVYFKALCRRAQQLNVQDAILWWVSSLSDTTSLWALTDVYLRPSITDGDSVAVREALAVGTQVVASDACERPSGVWLFPSRNLSAFVATIETAINKGRCAAGINSPDYFNEIMRIYSELSPALAEKTRIKVP